MARQGRAFPGDPGHGCKHGRPAAFVVTIFFGDPTTVSNNTRKLRLRGIVVATSLALAGTSAFAAQVQTAGLEPGQQYDRFIIKLKADAMAKSAAEGRLDGVLFNASPDILEQIRASATLQPRSARVAAPGETTLSFSSMTT